MIHTRTTCASVGDVVAAPARHNGEARPSRLRAHREVGRARLTEAVLQASAPTSSMSSRRSGREVPDRDHRWNAGKRPDHAHKRMVIAMRSITTRSPK